MPTEYVAPIETCRFFDDFWDVNTVATTGKWIKNGINTEVVTISDLPDGILSLVTGGADNDTAELQSQGAQILLAANTKYTFKIKFNSTTANATKNLHEWFVGLMAKDTTAGVGAAVDLSTDELGFQKDVGDDNIDLVIRRATGTIDRVAAIGTWASATNFVLELEVVVGSSVGSGVVRVKINRAPVVLSGGSYDYQTSSLPTTVALAVTMAIGAGSADIATMLVDYVDVRWPRLTT